MNRNKDVPVQELTAYYRSRGSVVRTRVRAGRPGAQIPVGAGDFYLLQNDHTGSGAHPASCSVGIGVLSQQKSGRGVKLTTDPRLVPRLGMSRAMPLFSQCPFMMWTGKTRCVRARVLVGRYSIVGVGTLKGLDGHGIESGLGSDILRQSRPVLGPSQPPVQCVSGHSR